MFEVTVSSCAINVWEPRSSLYAVCSVKTPRFSLHRETCYIGIILCNPPCRALCILTWFLITLGPLLLLWHLLVSLMGAPQVFALMVRWAGDLAVQEESEVNENPYLTWFSLLMFAGFDHLVSQDSFAPAILTSLMHIYWGMSWFKAPCAGCSLFSIQKEGKATKLLCACVARRSFQELLRNQIASTFDCRCRKGIKITNPRSEQPLHLFKGWVLAGVGPRRFAWECRLMRGCCIHLKTRRKGQKDDKVWAEPEFGQNSTSASLMCWKVLVWLLETLGVGALASCFFPRDKRVI